MGGCERAFTSQFNAVPAKEQATETLPCASLAISLICFWSASCAVKGAPWCATKSRTRRAKEKLVRIIFQVLPASLARVAQPGLPAEWKRQRENRHRSQRSPAGRAFESNVCRTTFRALRLQEVLLIVERDYIRNGLMQ